MMLLVLRNLIGAHPQGEIYIRIYARLGIQMQGGGDKGQSVIGDTRCLCQIGRDTEKSTDLDNPASLFVSFTQGRSNNILTGLYMTGRLVNILGLPWSL